MYAVVFALLIVIFYMYTYRERYEGEESGGGWNEGDRDVLNGEPLLQQYYSDRIVYYLGTHGPILKGQAPTPKVCYDWAKRNGLNHWGWKNDDNSCFFYTDPSVLTIMESRSNIINSNTRKIGCTEPGVKVTDGCMDWTNGDMVWGIENNSPLKKINRQYRPSQNTLVSNLLHYRQTTLEDCRKFAEEQEYDAFVYGTNINVLGSDAYKRTNCYGVYENTTGLYDWMGSKDESRYISACTDKTKKIRKGCK